MIVKIWKWDLQLLLTHGLHDRTVVATNSTIPTTPKLAEINGKINDVTNLFNIIINRNKHWELNSYWSYIRGFFCAFAIQNKTAVKKLNMLKIRGTRTKTSMTYLKSNTATRIYLKKLNNKYFICMYYMSVHMCSVRGKVLRLRRKSSRITVTIFSLNLFQCIFNSVSIFNIYNVIVWLFLWNTQSIDRKLI